MAASTMTTMMTATTTTETLRPQQSPFTKSIQTKPFQVATTAVVSMATTENGPRGEIVRNGHNDKETPNGHALRLNGHFAHTDDQGHEDESTVSEEEEEEDGMTNGLCTIAPAAAHDNDDDSGLSPFPEYREPNDDEPEEDLRGDMADFFSRDGRQIPSAPSPAASSAQATSSAASEDDTTTVSTPADPAAAPEAQPQPGPRREPQREAQRGPEEQPLLQIHPDTTTSPSPPQPRPQPPPPYWMHSSAGPHSGNHAGPALDTAGTATAGISSSSSSSSSSSRGPVPNRTGGLHPNGHSLRPVGINGKKKNKNKNATTTSSSSTTSYHPSHHRDTSSCSAVDLITLQDNEADAATGAYTSQANGRFSQFANRSAATATAASGPGSNNNNNSNNSASSRCWAKRVELTDYVVVNGGSVSSSGRKGLRGGSSGGGGGVPNIKLLPSAPAIGGLSLGAFVAWTVRVETLAGGTFVVHKRYSEFDALRRRLVASFPTACAAAVPALPPKSVLGKFRPGFLDRRRLGLQYFLNCILLNPEFSGSPILQEFLFS